MSAQPASMDVLSDLIRQVRREQSLACEINGSTRFVADLGLGSLELIGLVFMCEQTFGVDLVNREGLLSGLRTAGDALAAIRELQHDVLDGAGIHSDRSAVVGS